MALVLMSVSFGNPAVQRCGFPPFGSITKAMYARGRAHVMGLYSEEGVSHATRGALRRPHSRTCPPGRVLRPRPHPSVPPAPRKTSSMLRAPLGSDLST